MSKTYNLIGKRWLRKYVSAHSTPVYAAESEVSRLANTLCEVKWQRVSPKDAIMTYHTDDIVYYADPVEKTGGITGLDYNVMIRDNFDAALFCGHHSAGNHIVYGNAACYKFVLPDMQSYPTLERLKVDITSDPYNSTGARLAIYTNSTGEIPMDCATCRQGSAPSQGHSCTKSGNAWTTNDTYADAVAPREARDVTVSGKTQTNWYPVNGTCEFVLTGGLQLQKYLFVFVLLENYNTARGNWVEGCSFIANRIRLQTSGTVTGWTDGSTIDLSNDSVGSSEVGTSSVDVVKDGIVPDIVGDDSPFVGVTVLDSGTVPRTTDDRIASVLPQVTDEMTSKNLNSGIATVLGILGGDDAERAAIGTTNPVYRNFGAGYCIHHSSDLKFVDRNGNEANPKTLCVTAASLMVPFGLDKGVEMGYAKFDWSTWFLGAVTPAGAKLNFWMKTGSFEQSYPDLTDTSFYSADADTVKGWKLLASEPVASGSVTVDLSQAVNMAVSGNNTILVTAYVPVSAVDPTDTSDFSKGVGSFWYNAVTPDANLKIDIDLYPTFSPSKSYPKNAEVSYGTNLLKEWNACSGTTGRGFAKTMKSQYRRLAFGSTGILYSDDGIVWNASNVTSSAAEDVRIAYETSGVAVAVLGSSAYATSSVSGQEDGRAWDTVKSLGSLATCADRQPKGMLVGTMAGAYRVSSNGFSASDWEAIQIPAVPTRAVSVIPNDNAFGTDSQIIATDKGVYCGGVALSLAQFPSTLKAISSVSGIGASLVCSDSGLFTKSSNVWLWNSLIGDVRYVNTEASTWVACVDNGIAYSTNGGVTWTMSAATGRFLGIAYDGGVWVATGDGVLSWSTDGVAWMAVEGPVGSCARAIRVDPYWYAGFSDGKVFVSETGKDWTLTESSSMPNGVVKMYETDQGVFARMGVVCSANGLFRTILDDSSLFFYRSSASMWMYGSTWSGSYGSKAEMTWPFFDACNKTTESNGRHIIAASSQGLFTINLSDDGYMNDGWVQDKGSVSMGTVCQVIPGGSSPSTYMLARALDGTVYRYGTDINSQTIEARRHLTGSAINVWEYVFRPKNGRVMNLSYGMHSSGDSDKLKVTVDYGNHSLGNSVYNLYSAANERFPVDKDGYFVFYDDGGTAHRFKIVDNSTPGQVTSVSNLALQFATGDTWDASWFTRTNTEEDTQGQYGIYYPAGSRWSLNDSTKSATSFYINWYVTFNDTHTEMSLRYYVSGASYMVTPTQGSMSFYSADGEALTATFDSSTEKLSVVEGTCWRDVNTLTGSSTPQLPGADFILSDSTGDYAFSRDRIYKSTNNALTWSLVDMLVDHCPFVHLKSSATLCLAVDAQGRTFQSSDNGHNWTPYQNTTSTPRFDLVNGKWFSKGTDKMMVSDDGVEWTDTSVTLADVTCIEYGGSVYACACPSGVYRSVDGIRWTKMSGRADVKALTYEGDHWTASSGDGILWSGDDPIFESHDIPAAPVSGFNKVYRGNSILVGCSSDMSGLWYSTDNGSTWTRSNVTAGNFYDVTSDGLSTYVAVGNGGVYYGSGTSWTKVSSVEGDFRKVAYASSRFVAVGAVGLIYSSNGSSWTNPFPAFTDIIYGSSVNQNVSYSWTSVGIRWAAVNSNGLYYCNDGSSWVKVGGTSGTFTALSRTRNKSRVPYATTGSYLIAYSSSQTWYAPDNDVSNWTKFAGLSATKYTKIEKTANGWLAARATGLWYSLDGSGWFATVSPDVGTISDVWANSPNGEIVLVSGSTGAAWSSDLGETWTKFNGIGAVKEIIPGAPSATGIYASAVLFLNSGEAYAVNLYNGSSFTPVATKLIAPGNTSTFVAVACYEAYNGSHSGYHLQASDFTDYAVSATTSFYSTTPLYDTYTGLGAKLNAVAVGNGQRMIAATNDGIYASSSAYYTNFTWTKVSDSSSGIKRLAIPSYDATSLNAYAAEASGKIYKSTDNSASVWNVISNGLSASLSAVVHTGSLWLASGSKTIVSSNGTTWTDSISGVTDATAVGGSSANLIVANASGYAYSSNSGTNWTSSSAMTNASRIVYLNSLWYACTPSGLFTSPDMATWTARIGSSSVADVLLNGSQWLAIGNYGSVPSVWTSSDGLTWTRAAASTTVPMFGTSLCSAVVSDTNYVVSGQAGTYVSASLSSWVLAYHSGIPSVNSVDECGDYLIACTSQGVFYSLNKGTTWYPTNLHSGSFYRAAHRKYSVSNTTDQFVVVGDIGVFKAFKIRTASSLTFYGVSAESSFMTLGFTDVVRGDGHRWFAVSTAGLYYSADAQVSGWARLVDISFSSLTRDGQTIISAGVGGIYCSQNGGANWTASNLISGGTIGTMMGFSKVSKVGSVWIAASGDEGIYSELAEDTRIYYSKDGVTWNLGSMDFGDYATGLAYTAYGTNTVTDGSRLFTGLRHYLIGQAGCGQYTNGVYYSDDCGRSWSLCTGTRGLSVRGMVYDSSTDLVYAVVGIPVTTSYGIWISADHGKTWRRLGTNGDKIYSAPFVSGGFSKGYLWMFGATDGNINLYRMKSGTGFVAGMNAYRSKGDTNPSQFDYDDWEEIENPIRNRLFGANTLCIPDITLYA